MTHPITSKRIAERFNLANKAEFVRLSVAGALSNVTVCTERGRLERISEGEARLVMLEGRNVYADVHQTGGFSDAPKAVRTAEKEHQKR